MFKLMHIIFSNFTIVQVLNNYYDVEPVDGAHEVLWMDLNRYPNLEWFHF